MNAIKKLLSSPVAVVTFFFGVAIVVLLQLPLIPDSSPVEPDAVATPVACPASLGFPGISREVSNLSKGKSGYFPAGLFSSSWDGEDTFINDWYGKHLTAMREKSLLDADGSDTEIYRFLWLRSFHHPISVRVERQDNDIYLYTTELTGAGGYEPGQIFRSQVIRLDQAKWCDLLRLIDEAKFWNEPSNKEKALQDGAQWILEGVKEHRYHLVDRQSPRVGRYRDACIYMLELSGIDTHEPDNDIY